MTIGEWVRLATARLDQAGIGAARLEAQLLAAHVELRDRSWVLAHPEAPLAEHAAEGLLQRRESGEPLAYLLGWREFYGRRFAVDRRVLIPRHETETLVEVALNFPGGRVLDLCCGSGCVGLTLALERPAWRVVLSDVSPDALAVAERNRSDLDAGAALACCDLVGGISGPFDLVVSNPPYVARGDALPREVADFEPALALFADEDGLSIYRRMAAELPRVMAPEGVLLTEIGDGMELAVAGCFEAWRRLGSWRDAHGTARVMGFGV